MRTVFLGTPAAAIPSLESLTAVADVALVVTRPDRPRGRSGTPAPSPVKEAAERLGVRTAQPERSQDLAAILAAEGPFDCAVLVAFGMLIRPDALRVPSAGYVNVHFSALPRWRGAAPVQRAIMAGDTRTGVTLIRLDEGLDTGPILVTATTAIGDREHAGALTSRLADTGAELIRSHLPAIVSGSIVPIAQNEEEATLAPRLAPEERRLDLYDSPGQLIRRIRALAPSPGAWVAHDSDRLQILEAAAVESDPGRGILDFDGRRLVLGLGAGGLELIAVKPSGRRAMTGEEWARGRPHRLGRVT